MKTIKRTMERERTMERNREEEGKGGRMNAADILVEVAHRLMHT